MKKNLIPYFIVKREEKTNSFDTSTVSKAKRRLLRARKSTVIVKGGLCKKYVYRKLHKPLEAPAAGFQFDTPCKANECSLVLGSWSAFNCYNTVESTAAKCVH